MVVWPLQCGHAFGTCIRILHCVLHPHASLVPEGPDRDRQTRTASIPELTRTSCQILLNEHTECAFEPFRGVGLMCSPLVIPAISFHPRVRRSVAACTPCNTLFFFSIAFANSGAHCWSCSCRRVLEGAGRFCGFFCGAQAGTRCVAHTTAVHCMACGVVWRKRSAHGEALKCICVPGSHPGPLARGSGSPPLCTGTMLDCREAGKAR